MHPLRGSQVFWLLAVLLVGACGYSDAGDGTGTLLVHGALEGSFASLSTDLTFNVAQNGAAVPDATVTLVDADSQSTCVLVYHGEQQRYVGVWPGLHHKVKVQVSRGGEALSARIEGPSRHTVAHPHTGAVLRLQDALDVRWATQDGLRADSVDVVVNDAAREVVRHALPHDSGQAHMAASELSGGPLELTVTRKTQLVPKGGAAGSALVASYSVTTHLVRQ